MAETVSVPSQSQDHEGFPFLVASLLLAGLAHRSLASMALHYNSKQLMAFSLGSTPVVVTSDPQVAKEILTSPHFADRPSSSQLVALCSVGPSASLPTAPTGVFSAALLPLTYSHQGELQHMNSAAS
ncbi:cytochrome [Sesamum angolense]|uniref:Cytochrome n=1 Tax=Sesamum angolense TaxID=2727404 RepID=A0AAE2C781_9LAMI|nr:cytochrome [Sesamum angolense]